MSELASAVRLYLDGLKARDLWPDGIAALTLALHKHEGSRGHRKSHRKGCVGIDAAGAQCDCPTFDERAAEGTPHE